MIIERELIKIKEVHRSYYGSLFVVGELLVSGNEIRMTVSIADENEPWWTDPKSSDWVPGHWVAMTTRSHSMSHSFKMVDIEEVQRKFFESLDNAEW